MGNRYQEMFSAVLFWKSYLFHQQALALEMMQVISVVGAGTIINLSKVNIISCICTAVLSFWVVSR